MNKYGYKNYLTKRYWVKRTFFSKLDLDDDFINSANMNDKVNFFENANHIVVITSDGAIIYTKENEKHLKNYKTAIKFIANHILCNNTCTFYGVTFEGAIIDYIRDIEKVEKYTKDLKIDRTIKQQYNRSRANNKCSSRDDNEEHYCVSFNSEYYTDEGIGSRREISFSTAEYYDDIIGKISATISTTSLETDFNKLSLINFNDEIKKLKEKQFELFINSFTQEYLDTLKKA